MSPKNIYAILLVQFIYSEKATKIWSNLETLKSNFKKKFGQIGLLRISDLHKKECHLRINFNQFSGERCERKQCRHNWHVRSVLLIRHPCGKIVRLSGKSSTTYFLWEQNWKLRIFDVVEFVQKSGQWAQVDWFDFEIWKKLETKFDKSTMSWNSNIFDNYASDIINKTEIPREEIKSGENRNQFSLWYWKTPQPQKSYNWAELKTPLFRISCYTKVIPIVARAHYWLAGWGYSFHQQFHSQSHLYISHAVSKIWDLGWPAVLKISAI